MQRCRAFAAQSINIAIIREHWEFGRRIVEEEQNGESRAAYGDRLLIELSKQLTLTLGRGFGVRNLADFRKFYLQNPDWEILHPRVQNLKWSHFKILLRVDDETAREWYINEASQQMWSKRTLDRNVSSQYYYRLLSTPDKCRKEVVKEMEDKTSGDEYKPLTPEQFIKSPFVTEFLGMSKDASFTEHKLKSLLKLNLNTVTHL